MPIIQNPDGPVRTRGSAECQRRGARPGHIKAQSTELFGAAHSAVAWVERQNDRAIEAQANAELRKSAYYAVRHLRCEVRNNVLTLRGRVPNFYTKQIAQTAVDHLLCGGLVLDSQLEVEQS